MLKSDLILAIERERPSAPDRISSTPSVRRSGGDSIEYFGLTNVSASPMTGIHIQWNGTMWIAGPLGSDVEIYPHPASDAANYMQGGVWAIKKGNRWFAMESSNFQFYIC